MRLFEKKQMIRHRVLLDMHIRSILLCLIVFAYAGLVGHAQISFTSAIGLALQNSPRVKMAQDNVKKAAAVLTEATNVYIPTISATSGLGVSSGITLNVPTVFTISAQSLVLNYSQPDYIRSAKLGIRASDLTLAQIRQEVDEDTAVTYLSLDIARLRQTAMADQYSNALRLVTIVQERLAAGLETDLELKKAQRTAVQIRLQQLQLEDQTASLNDHLGRLIGMPGTQLETLPESIPSPPANTSSHRDDSFPDAPDVLSADANAHAKLLQALGDSRYTWRPQLMFQAQYSRISPFNNVSTYYNLDGDYNTLAAGVQIQLPFLDRGRKAKASQSMSDALHAQHESAYARDQQAEIRLKLQHSLAELAEKYNLADLDHGIAQDQLNAMLVQLQLGTGNSTAPSASPKDEQNARIQERQKYLDLLDTKLQLREAEIYLLRQTGELEHWIESALESPGAALNNPNSASREHQ
jgi:outer membrane protein TolC